MVKEFNTSFHDDMINHVIKLTAELKTIKWWKFKRRMKIKASIKSGTDLIYKGVLKQY